MKKGILQNQKSSKFKQGDRVYILKNHCYEGIQNSTAVHTVSRLNEGKALAYVVCIVEDREQELAFYDSELKLAQ